MAENMGFEPTIPCGIQVFETCALGHYATPPQNKCALGGTRTHNLNIRNVVHYPIVLQELV